MTQENQLPQNSKQLHQQLQQFALEAQSYQAKSAKRRQALHKLLSLLQTSGILYSPDAEAEAKQNALLEIARNIDNYDSAKGSVLAWAKGIFNSGG